MVRGRRRTRRYAQKRDLSIVRSIQWRYDVIFASPTRSLRRKGTIPRAARIVVFNEERKIIFERSISRIKAAWSFHTGSKKKNEEERMQVRWCLGDARDEEERRDTWMSSDDHLLTCIPLFSPWNNHLVFVRPTRILKESDQREKIGEMGGRLDAKGRRNTFSSSLRPQKRKSREIKMIEGDRRSEDEIHDAPGKTL